MLRLCARQWCQPPATSWACASLELHVTFKGNCLAAPALTPVPVALHSIPAGKSATTPNLDFYGNGAGPVGLVTYSDSWQWSLSVAPGGKTILYTISHQAISGPLPYFTDFFTITIEYKVRHPPLAAVAEVVVKQSQHQQQ